MHPVKDYAKTEYMNAWLRHPVLGDPSFDTFQRLGGTIHQSAPPFEWAVNGSVFRDHDGTWYYYAGLYARGYSAVMPGQFRIYRSVDQGTHWEDLGWGFEEGFCFEGDDAPSDGYPDVVICYDEKQKKYLLTYDTYTYDRRWLDTPDPLAYVTSGAALAWADSPAGPFTRLKHRFVTNDNDLRGTRFSRSYASTVIPRQKDYIAFILVDSGPYYTWGLAVATAPAAEGPWSAPRMILCCDRAEYYPCPVEFYPAFVIDDVVYCPATSVAKNRNYQALFSAPLEQAHESAAWKLTENGNLWHSRDLPDEYHGIWGQTYHGFVEPDTGRFVAMFPSRDKVDQGTLCLAARPWNTPHSDGFVMTAHGGPSISALLAAYDDFVLDAELRIKGTVDIAFGYCGILGPNDSVSDSVPSKGSLADYRALRLENGSCSVISRDGDGGQRVYAKAPLDEKDISLRMAWQKGCLDVWINGTQLFCHVALPDAAKRSAPLALILGEFSRIECDRFEVNGEATEYSLSYNATDALLGAGQLRPDDRIVKPADRLQPDRWHRISGGYAGEGNIAAKWNVIGSRFALTLQKDPAYGVAGVWVDGVFQGQIDLCGAGETVFMTQAFAMGPHGVRVAPIKGRIAIGKLTVTGNPE